MSAFTQPRIYMASRQLSELDAMREMSRIAAVFADLADGLEGLIGAVLSVSGMRQIRIETSGFNHFLELPLHWTAGPGDGPEACAIAPMCYSGQNVGELRLCFEALTTSVESPVRFARFIAQQVAGMIDRTARAHENRKLEKRIEIVARRIRTRKAVLRATGILSRARCVGEQAARKMMLDYTRTSGWTLCQVAEAVILTDGAVWSQRPVLRRVSEDAPTCEVAGPIPTGRSAERECLDQYQPVG